MAAETQSAPGRVRRALASARREPGLWLGLAGVALMLLAGYLAPLPYDPMSPTANTMQAPSGDHWFGTDRFGYDVLSRTVYAARIDLPLAIGGALLSAVIGVILGLLASGRSRWSNWLVRAVDIMQAFPILVVAICVVALAGNNLSNVIYAILLVNVPRFIRLVRSQALTVRELRFMDAAVAFGATRRRVLFRHLLPNVSSTIVAQTSLATAQAIVIIASLSFLGIGIQIPQASWGAMIRIGSQNMTTGEWWVSLFPGMAVFVAVVCLNAIAGAVQARYERTSR